MSGVGHDNRHRCQPPTIVGLTVPYQPDWTCGICGRVWRDMASGASRWWAELGRYTVKLDDPRVAK